jgi:hypothetical protein
MKRNLFIASFVLIGSMATAQPVINASDFNPTLLTSINYKYGTGQTVIDPGAGGANVTWNFSSLNLSTNLNNSVYACPSGADCGDFPDATGYFQSSVAEPFYKRTATEWIQVGEKSTTTGGLLPYEGGYKLLQFPVTYQQTFSDDYLQSGMLNGMTFTRNGVLNSTIDGYGTLITPNGTYTNVLRQKLVDQATMTTGGATENITNTQYYWYQAGAHHQIMALIVTETSVSGAPVDLPTIYTVSYSTLPVTTGLQDVDKLSRLITVFPNPVTAGAVHIKHPADLQVDKVIVTDITGKAVVSEYTNRNIDMVISLENCAAGIYFCRLYTDKGTAVKKIVLK